MNLAGLVEFDFVTQMHGGFGSLLVQFRLLIIEQFTFAAAARLRVYETKWDQKQNGDSEPPLCFCFCQQPPLFIRVVLGFMLLTRKITPPIP